MPLSHDNKLTKLSEMCFIPSHNWRQANPPVSCKKGKERKDDGSNDEFPIIQDLEERFGLQESA
jgi:hypothetical protein